MQYDVYKNDEYNECYTGNLDNAITLFNLLIAAGCDYALITNENGCAVMEYRKPNN